MPHRSQRDRTRTRQRLHRTSRKVGLCYQLCWLALAASLTLTGCGPQRDDSESPAPDEAVSTEPQVTNTTDHRAQADDRADSDDWRPLFNGHDLTGWTTSVGAIDAWGAVAEELVTLRPGKGDWLFTDEKFTDFELQLEFFLPADANSGVGLRVADIGDPGYGGYEIQLVDSAGQQPTLRNAGAIFDIAPAKVMAIHPPNQWNTLRIKLIGQTLDVWLNGRRIHDSRTLPPLPDRDPFTSGEETTGRISLQDNGGSVRYRNIRIHVLPGAADGVFSLDQLDRR